MPIHGPHPTVRATLLSLRKNEADFTLPPDSITGFTKGTNSNDIELYFLAHDI